MGNSLCDECNGKTERKNIDFSLYGVSFGKFPAEVCLECGEVVFDEEVAYEVEKIAKEKGLWGLDATAKVSRIGSSVGITINKRIAQFMNLEQGEQVFLHPENRHRLVLEVR